MILTKRASRTQWPNTTRERLPRNLATEDKGTEKTEEEEITEEEEVAVMVIERTEDQEPNLVNTTTIEDKVATEMVTEEETITEMAIEEETMIDVITETTEEM